MSRAAETKQRMAEIRQLFQEKGFEAVLRRLVREEFRKDTLPCTACGRPVKPTRLIRRVRAYHEDCQPAVLGPTPKDRIETIDLAMFERKEQLQWLQEGKQTLQKVKKSLRHPEASTSPPKV